MHSDWRSESPVSEEVVIVRWLAWLLLLALVGGCAAADRRFPLAAPMRVDTDLRPVKVACRHSPTKKDSKHVSCAPDVYVSPLIWDGADNLVFRPLSEGLAVARHGEAMNANSLDEVPDSAWFTNRLGFRELTPDEFAMGACTPSQLLDADSAPDGSWIIDHGKTDGASPGFRVSVAGKGKYLFKGELATEPERASAASVIGAAVYASVGFNTSCEQVVYFRPTVLRLTPGLIHQKNFGGKDLFDQSKVDKILSDSTHRGSLVRMQASAWLPGYLIGPFRYTGTRGDDPNDIIPHDERRELRGARVIAAWLDHFDSREQNSLDAWVVDSTGPHSNPDESPGHVVHNILDTSDCLGSTWGMPAVDHRLGYSYVLDWGDMARDLVTLGIPSRPWDRVQQTPGQEVFNYFNVKDFVPDEWKNEYPNAAFSRMTERDAAWITRILSYIKPEMVDAVVRRANFTDPERSVYLTDVLEGRLRKILERYLTRLSPLANIQLVDQDQVCASDRAEATHLRPDAQFRYEARLLGGRALPVERFAEGQVCVRLPHVSPDAGPPDDDASRYVKVALTDGVARGPLVAHLYDLGPARGYRLVGVERPEQ
jgi:hypothetical protein